MKLRRLRRVPGARIICIGMHRAGGRRISLRWDNLQGVRVYNEREKRRRGLWHAAAKTSRPEIRPEGPRPSLPSVSLSSLSRGINEEDVDARGPSSSLQEPLASAFVTPFNGKMRSPARDRVKRKRRLHVISHNNTRR